MPKALAPEDVVSLLELEPNGASTEWPGVVPEEDVEIGDAEALAAVHPSAAVDIRAIADAVRPAVSAGDPR